MKTFLIATILLFCTHNLLLGQEDTYETASIRVDGVFYKAIYKSSDWSITIVKPDRKVVLHLDNYDRHDEGFDKFKFVDFNGDGYKDLLIEYMSNVPRRCDLILYNRHNRKFVLLKEFSNYPDPQKVKGTHLYYSYHRSGCADADWDSDLFKIINNTIIKIGNISGRDCGDVKTGIFISKVKGSEKMSVTHYPIDELKKYKSYKWGFIKYYWSSNYSKFL